MYIKEIKDLPSPDQLPKDIKKLMIFDDVGGKEQVINENLKQNIISTDRQNVRENCNLFIFFEQRGRAIYHDFFNRAELSYDLICEKLREERYSYIVNDKSKKRNINVKLRINWDWRVL